MEIIPFILSLCYTFIACFGFEFIFHIRGKVLYTAPIGSVILWGVYLLLQPLIASTVIRCFIATAISAIYSETAARLIKTPAIVFMVIAILPLVPGSGIYYTMEACIQRDYDKFLTTGIETIGIAGAIAVAMLLISSLFRIGTLLIKHSKAKKSAE